MTRSVQYYGWVPDLPDRRDKKFKLNRPRLEPLPDTVDLRPGCPPVWDQGQIGSCTAHAVAAAFQYELKRQGLPDFAGSRLFEYYNSRQIEGTENQDSGAMIRDAIKAIAEQGICDESDWPYDIEQFAVKPPDEAYASALKNLAIQYQRLSGDLTEMLTSLANNLPFVFGFSVYDAFESEAMAASGELAMPGDAENLLGGHAVLAVGYDRPSQRFLVRNSWGADWGMEGYFWMPFAYLMDSNLSDDRWSISQVEELGDETSKSHRGCP